MSRHMDVKICGLTSIEDARVALDAGADFLGFVLYAKSPRAVTARRLRQIADALPSGARAVAVFVNARRRAVETIARDSRLYAVQIHGDEEAGEFDGMPVPVWRAVRFGAGSWAPAPAAWLAARYVVDAAAPGRYGGSGATADWTAAGGFARKYPVMLAGGLTPGNVLAAIRAVRPLGVDAASGVEAAPGKKDAAKVAAFVNAARAIERARERDSEAGTLG